MNKRIFIRYFKLKENQIPDDSNAIVNANNPLVSRYLNDYGIGANVDDWLARYPNGKVDFVCLP